jgi:hypothetical protein
LAEDIEIEKDKIEKEVEKMVPQKTEEKSDEKPIDIPVERIQRMKKAFRPTWLQDQINSTGKGSNGKKE